MDELKKALTDRYEGWELAEILSVSAEDIIEAFPELIEDNRDALEDLLELNESDYE